MMNYIKYSTIVLCLFSFQLLRAQTPEQLKSWLPAIEGWELSAAEVFNPDNLYDRINGAAPLYLENNFREMTAIDYKKGSDYVTVQAYRHASPEDAFGMYASERASDYPFLPSIGGEAQGDAENLFFFAGDIYVKMSSHSATDVEQILQTIAKGLADKIAPQAGYPEIVKAFPQTGKLPHSETYITSSYIGHEFLKSVYTATYEVDGKTFQLFVVNGKSEAGAKEVLTNYFTFNKQPLDFQPGELQIKDRYNGNIPALWKGSYIIGAYSESGDPIPGAPTLLKAIADKL
jgi:hypothetical protein